MKNSNTVTFVSVSREVDTDTDPLPMPQIVLAPEYYVFLLGSFVKEVAWRCLQ